MARSFTDLLPSDDSRGEHGGWPRDGGCEASVKSRFVHKTARNASEMNIGRKKVAGTEGTVSCQSPTATPAMRTGPSPPKSGLMMTPAFKVATPSIRCDLNEKGVKDLA